MLIQERQSFHIDTANTKLVILQRQFNAGLISLSELKRFQWNTLRIAGLELSTF